MDSNFVSLPDSAILGWIWHLPQSGRTLNPWTCEMRLYSVWCNWFFVGSISSYLPVVCGVYIHSCWEGQRDSYLLQASLGVWTTRNACVCWLEYPLAGACHRCHRLKIVFETYLYLPTSLRQDNLCILIPLLFWTGSCTMVKTWCMYIYIYVYIYINVFIRIFQVIQPLLGLSNVWIWAYQPFFLNAGMTNRSSHPWSGWFWVPSWLRTPPFVSDSVYSAAEIQHHKNGAVV